MKFFAVAIIIYFFFSANAQSKEISNGQMMYQQAIYFLQKSDYKNAFIYFSGSCYNNYLPGCDMMGIVEYQIDKDNGAQICKAWINKLEKSKNPNDKMHLKQVLTYYIDIFNQLDNKDLSNYFKATYKKVFMGVQIEQVNPKKRN